MKRLGQYVIEAPIGGGGIATIYRARHEPTGMAFAVKVLKSTPDGGEMLRVRFLREAKTIARLTHPNIVDVIDVGVQDDEVYMVLELLGGESLQATIARGLLPPARALAIVDRLLGALVHCHEHHVVHRDVKPSNVMLLEGDVPKLIDFGLAKASRDVGDKLTETGTVHGTPHYMSPEQCRGEDVGPASDIYSVGVLSYEMLAGKTPFAGGDAATLMAAHLFVDPPALANVPPGVAAVVRSALAKRPEDRPTASALRTMLADAMTGADPVTRGALDAERRVDHLTKAREERALGGAPAITADAQGVVFVWMAHGPRSASLLGCLGTAGIEARLVESDDVPSGLVIASGLERLRRFRERDRKSAVIVVDVGGPDETTEAIRLGANDMLLRESPDADLVVKVQRLLRRRARS